MVLAAIICIQGTNAQTVQLIKFEQLKKRAFNQSDTTYVINFFASWCAPCIKEIPIFKQLIDSTKNTATLVLFISVDFKSEMDKSVMPIAKQYNMPTIYLLDEPNANKWINEIDNNWSGSIPATLIVKRAKRKKLIVAMVDYPKLIKLIK